MIALALALIVAAEAPVVLVHPPLFTERTAIVDGVEQALRARGFEVLSRKTVAQVLSESSARGVVCRDPEDAACFVKLGLAADATRVVVPFAFAAGGKERVSVLYLDITTGAQTRAVLEGGASAAAYDDVVAELLGEKRRVDPVGALVVNAPPGTTLLVDGVDRGKAPIAALAGLAPGTHEVVAVVAGRSPRAVRVEVEAGKTATVDVAPGEPLPPPEPSPVPPTGSTSPAQLYAGIGAGVAGAVAAGSLVGALVVETRAQSVVDRWRTDPAATLDELPGLEAVELALFGTAAVAGVATGALAMIALAE